MGLDSARCINGACGCPCHKPLRLSERREGAALAILNERARQEWSRAETAEAAAAALRERVACLLNFFGASEKSRRWPDAEHEEVSRRPSLRAAPHGGVSAAGRIRRVQAEPAPAVSARQLQRLGAASRLAEAIAPGDRRTARESRSARVTALETARTKGHHEERSPGGGLVRVARRLRRHESMVCAARHRRDLAVS